jgi:hypothetical protein
LESNTLDGNAPATLLSTGNETLIDRHHRVGGVIENVETVLNISCSIVKENILHTEPKIGVLKLAEGKVVISDAAETSPKI